MGTKTYAQLTAETTIEDGDLLATYRGTLGPLKRITAALLRTFVQATVPAVMIDDKSANYTVLAADIGKTFNGTGTITLSLMAAATLGEGFNFGINNTGTGVITIDPNGGELIEGRATICVYPGEGFKVVCTGTAFICQGRDSSVDLGTYTTSTAQAELECLLGVGDTEFTSIEANVQQLAGGTSNAIPRLLVRKDGVYGPSNHTYTITINGGGTVVGFAAGSVAFIRLGFENQLLGGQIALTGLGSAFSFATFVTGDVNGTASTGSGNIAGGLTRVDGFKFAFSSGNISSGAAVTVRGVR